VIYLGVDRISYRKVAFKPGQPDPIQTFPISQNLVIYLGVDRISYRKVAFKPGQPDPIQTFPMNQTQIGRWVKVTRSPPFQQLTLCEVMVMGHCPKGKYVYINLILRYTFHNQIFTFACWALYKINALQFAFTLRHFVTFVLLRSIDLLYKRRIHDIIKFSFLFVLTDS